VQLLNRNIRDDLYLFFLVPRNSHSSNCIILPIPLRSSVLFKITLCTVVISTNGSSSHRVYSTYSDLLSPHKLHYSKKELKTSSEHIQNFRNFTQTNSTIIIYSIRIKSKFCKFEGRVFYFCHAYAYTFL